MFLKKITASLFLSTLILQAQAAQEIQPVVPDKSARESLWEAIQSGTVEDLETALSSLSAEDNITLLTGLGIEGCQDNLWQAAARVGRTDIMKKLGEKEVPVQMLIPGDTPLSIAMEAGHLLAAQCLLDRGADVNEPDALGYTPLHLAALEGDLSKVKFLLARSATISTTAKHGDTVLHLAVEAGEISLEVVKFLSSNAALINATNEHGNTALYMAIERSKELPFQQLRDVVQCLLDNNADIDKPNGECNLTALQLTARENYADMARFLLSKGASIDKKNLAFGDSTALHMAAGEGHVATIQILLDANANITVQQDEDNLRNTPLMLAAQSCKAMACQIFLKHGAERGLDIDALSGHSSDDASALTLAAGADEECIKEEERINTILCLLKWGSQVNHMKQGAFSALHIAAEKGKVRLAQVLLDHGANPDITNTQEQTPLNCAYKKGKKNVMRLLVARGAQWTNNELSSQFIDELARISQNRSRILCRMLKQKGMPRDIIGHIARFAR